MGTTLKPVTLTPTQQRMMEVARVGLMTQQPFYSHFMYSEMKECPTRDLPTAATDGRTIFYNPDYLEKLTTQEQIFVLAHEVDHAICRHPQRMKHYGNETKVRSKPFDPGFFNEVADYGVNAGLIEAGVGMMNPSWLWAPDVATDDLLEDTYERKWKDRPKGGGQGGGQGPSTYARSGMAPKSAKRDKAADGQGGSFDQVLEPGVDPVTGEIDELGEQEFKEAVARAASAARAMGKLPSHLARRIEAILEPQVDWREHVRMLLTGKMGNRSETWDRPNRRRLVLNPIVITPGRKGYGAELVVVAVDTSGSIGQRELDAFFAEVGGVLADVRPREVMVVACDAAVHQVEHLASLDELGELRGRGLKGGGGTAFEPVFELVEKDSLRPDTLIYLTDLMGSFPTVVPTYPVVWCATTDYAVPFGDVVRIKL